MKTEPNQPSFPVTEEMTDRIDGGVKIYSGLSKREIFAAMAMQGIISSFQYPIQKEDPDYVANLSLKCADALIAALNEKEG